MSPKPTAFFESRILLLLALTGLLFSVACKRASDSSTTHRRSSGPGERKWLVQIEVPGAKAEAIDRSVALPVISALLASEQTEVIGSRSSAGITRIFLRTSVLISSKELVQDALNSVHLPNGFRAPGFGAAGPSSEVEVRTSIRLDPRKLDRAGVLATDVISYLRSRSNRNLRLDRQSLSKIEIRSPGMFDVTLADLGSIVTKAQTPDEETFDWVLSVTGRDHREISNRLDSLLALIESRLRPRDPDLAWVRIPEVENGVWADLNLSEISGQGLRVEQVHEALAIAQGHAIDLWKDGRLVIEQPRIQKARLLEQVIRTPSGTIVPLQRLVWLRSQEQSSPVLRIGTDALAGFILLSGASKAEMESLVREAESEMELVWKPAKELVDGERALLAWPKIPNIYDGFVDLASSF